jgi:hypothetical protein
MKDMFTRSMFVFAILVMAASCTSSGHSKASYARPEDPEKTCVELGAEVERIEAKLVEVASGKADDNSREFKLVWDVDEGGNKDGERRSRYERLALRHGHLAGIADNKECGLTPNTPSTYDEARAAALGNDSMKEHASEESADHSDK